MSPGPPAWDNRVPNLSSLGQCSPQLCWNSQGLSKNLKNSLEVPAHRLPSLRVVTSRAEANATAPSDQHSHSPVPPPRSSLLSPGPCSHLRPQMPPPVSVSKCPGPCPSPGDSGHWVAPELPLPLGSSCRECGWHPAYLRPLHGLQPWLLCGGHRGPGPGRPQ